MRGRESRGRHEMGSAALVGFGVHEGAVHMDVLSCVI